LILWLGFITLVCHKSFAVVLLHGLWGLLAIPGPAFSFPDTILVHLKAYIFKFIVMVSGLM
jgi:hypothetical protein